MFNVLYITRPWLPGHHKKENKIIIFSKLFYNKNRGNSVLGFNLFSPTIPSSRAAEQEEAVGRMQESEADEETGDSCLRSGDQDSGFRMP